MNYGKKGIVDTQKSLTSKSVKLKKMCCISALKLILISLLAVICIGVCLGIGIFKGIIYSAPSISTLDLVPTGYATTVYDSEGNETAKLVAADANRSYVKMSQIPENLANAFVAIEDERFYTHNGIDIKGIFRAAYVAIKNKNLSEGASTITQQLLKNSVFDNWTNETTIQSIKRKIQEQYLAIELEKVMDKETILELYLNTINLGQGTLGVKAASLRYFNKQPYELTLSECAVIAAITQNPSKWNPISHPENNAIRREKVLTNMLTQGFITQDEYDEAMADDVYSRIAAVNVDAESNQIYSYFVDELCEQVLDDLMDLGYTESQAYNLMYSGGLSIYTTQDSSVQAICDEVFLDEANYPEGTKWYLNYALTIKKSNGDKVNYSTEMYKAYFKQTNSSFNLLYSSTDEAYAAIEEYKASVMESGDTVEGETISLTPQPQASIVIEDQSTGYIVAMVGGRGEKTASRTLNRATNTTRQPGSTFKILSTYAPAFDSYGLTLADVQVDAEFAYADGRTVKNWWTDGYRGILSLRYGIAQSANIVAVKTLTQITPQLGFSYLLDFGFTTLVDRRVESDGTVVSDIGQALALGGVTDGVTCMELNAGYATIANQGTYVQPKLYTKIVDHDGNVLIDNTEAETRQVLKESTAWLLTDAMVSVVTTGTGSSVNFGNMSIAGKTGTTSDYNDVWFAGFTPYYTCTTWAGYDNNAKLSGSAEKSLAKTLWKACMSKIHEDLPNKSFPQASGIVQAQVCSQSGRLPTELCQSAGCVVTEYFAEGTVPTEYCDVHYSDTICAYSGLKADELCPFKVVSTGTRIPERLSDAAINASIGVGTTTEEGTEDATATTDDTQTCPHNAAFFADPNAATIIEQQRQYLQQLAAAQAAQAAQTAETQTTQ